jgi:hypothetical protein
MSKIKSWLARGWFMLWVRPYRQGFEDGMRSARRVPANYLIMSRELLEDYKQAARREERELIFRERTAKK